MKHNRLCTIITVLLIASMLLSTMLFTASADETIVASTAFTGAGTATDPFIIATPADLYAMKTLRPTSGDNANYKGQYFKLTADIDLNPTWDASGDTKPTNVWANIWTFSGTIDGNNHTIKGIYISGASNSAFIVNATNATIKNLTIDNSKFNATTSYAGFISSINAGNTLTGIKFTSKVYCIGGGYVGSLAANLKGDSTITECESAAIISGKTNVGGLVGSTSSVCVFDKCKFTGSVTGDNAVNGAITNVTANVIAEFKDCGYKADASLVGVNAATSITLISYSYEGYTYKKVYDLDNIPKNGEGAEQGGTTTSKQETPKVVSNADWKANDQGIFEIATAADLQAFADKRTSNGNYAGKTVMLTADIDYNEGWDASSGKIPSNMWATMFRFDGTFDGQGHKITGIYTSGANASFITNLLGTVKNVNFVNCLFDGTEGNSAIIACIKNESFIENIYADVIVKNEKGNAGGIVGWFSTTANNETPKLTMKNCVFVGSVTAAVVAGGILGENTNYDKKNAPKIFEVSLTNCANYGTVKATATDGYAAGIIGYIYGNTTITNCVAGGKVEGGVAFINVVQDIKLEVLVTDSYALTGVATDLVKLSAVNGVKYVYTGAQDTTLKTLANSDAILDVAELKVTKADSWKKDTKTTFVIPVAAYDTYYGHDFETSIVAPKCNEEGYTSKVCKNCGTEIRSDYTEKVAHTPGEWIVDKAATEKSVGLKHQECSVCHENLQNEFIPKLETPTTEETTAEATTEAPTEVATEAPVEPVEKAGCGASIGSSIVCIVFALAMVYVACAKKKKEQ